jgi:hypothetical protein
MFGKSTIKCSFYPQKIRQHFQTKPHKNPNISCHRAKKKYIYSPPPTAPPPFVLSMTNHATCNAFEQSSGYISCTRNYPPSKSSAAKFVLHHTNSHKFIILLFLYIPRSDTFDVQMSNVTHR